MRPPSFPGTTAPLLENTFLLSAVAATLFRILIPFTNNPLDRLGSDPLRHWENGKRLFDLHFFAGSDPLGYQLFIYLVRFITQDNRIGVALCCGLLSALMPWFWSRAARELGLGSTTSLAVWAAIGWTPSLLTIYEYLMSETLLLALMGCSFWLSARALRKGSLPSFLAAVALWTLTLLTKPIPLPAAFCCLALCWLNSRNKLWDTLCGTLVVAILLSPAVWQSYRVLGFAAPFGNPWHNAIYHKAETKFVRIYWGDGEMYIFGSPSCFIRPLYPLSEWMIRRSHSETCIDIHASRTNGDADWRASDVTRTWSTWLHQLSENIVLLLFAPSWPESQPPTAVGVFNYNIRWLWAPLILVVVPMYICNRNAWRLAPMLPLATCVFTLSLIFQTTFLMEGRYRKALEPLLIMSALHIISLRLPPSRFPGESHLAQ